ncbi:two-component regulator propeller domain-containing protein [Seonamhaeicola marinus]|uniref:histidine kinase n=1 Tax=Seonamhaeicola marinus TaxID=1912246 RepID=A0A5D0ILX6_9FLAO|nr:two-component regulator propeller domain-containing protein [Seonamhaeicola marinus]TYA84178.1 response regulator [Seonamhaeicola marinus]
MRIKYHHLALIAFVLSFNIVLAQNKGYFERITTDEGLSQSDVNTIIQDDDGFMWFGTHDGLNRYDGYSFKIFKPDFKKKQSIPSNLIYTLEKDQNGNLWIGTTGEGLVFFDRTKETFVTYKTDKKGGNGLTSNNIGELYRDKENRLWIGTRNGLNMLDLKNLNEPLKFKHYKLEQDDIFISGNNQSVNTIYEDRNGLIWVGGYAGLYRLSRESNGDEYLRLANRDLGLPIAAVREIREINGKLLVATNDGLFFQRVKDNTLVFEKVIEGSFNNILINDNIIWVGTNKGLWRLKMDMANETFKILNTFIYDPKDFNSISKNNIMSLYRDKTGIIWAGTNGGGVNKYDPNRKEFLHIRKTLDPKSLSYDKIRSFFEDSNNTLWVGTEGGGLNRLKSTKDYNDYSKFNDLLNVYAIKEIKKGNKKFLLFGGQGIPSMYELEITNPDNTSFKNISPINDFDNSIFSLLVDSRNYLWIGTYSGGLYRWILNEDNKSYDKQRFTYDLNNPTSIPGDIIRNIKEDSEGNIWVGTSSGLGMLTAEEASEKVPRFKVFKRGENEKNTLSHNYILSINEDANKNIWIGTLGGGLNKLEKQENGYVVTKCYSESNGLPNNVVKGVLIDESENLWVSTNKGISKLNYKTEVFKNFDVNDGLQSNEFQELACLKRKDGEFLFGGVNGFNTFYPQKLRENTFIPGTVITNLLISNKAVEVREEVDGKVILNNVVSKTASITLKHFQNNLSFDFASLHYVAPQKNSFEYILEGFDKSWQGTSSAKRYASYTNLAPGDYVFKVKSSNNDGLWNNNPAQINIHITPPFWLTWWAYGIYGLCILGVFWGIQSYFNLRSQQKASLRIQKEVEEVNRLKLQFFTNISHEFKTPITLILNPIEELLESATNSVSVKSKLKIVQRNANSLLRLVHQLMEFRKIEVGETKLGATKANIVSFLKEITLSFKASAKKKNVNLDFKSDYFKLDVWFDWDKLEKIMNNLIFNAIKFTPSTGNITVKIVKPLEESLLPIEDRGMSVKYLQIEVQDSGEGIIKEELPYVFHRFYQVNNASKHANKGSGIGLAITKDLVDLHYGDITVESAEGEGSCFKIKLPLGNEHLLEEEMVRIKNPEPFIEVDDSEFILEEELNVEEDKSKLSVLVVDDNPDIRLLVKDGLAKTYKVFEAENGNEGLNKALKEMPDLIISDILMPEMDGIELCAALKANIRTSHIPVVLLTALNSVEHRIEGLESGADAYIPKPFKMRLLSVRVEKLIESRNLMRKRFQTEKEITPEKVTLNSVDEQFLREIMDLMEANMSNESYWVDQLVKDMNTSRSTLFRKLKKLTGQSPNDFIRIVRLKRAAQLLEQNELNVAQVSYMVGFSDPGYFGKCFRKFFGESPSKFVKKKMLN